MQMGLLLGRPRGTLGRKSKYWFKEFYNLLFGDLVNRDKLFLWGTETLNLTEGKMTEYIIREIHTSDFKQVVEVYNSNQKFLLNHLGLEFIDEDFISKEVSTMSNVGFRSCVIVNSENQTVQGVLDYKTDKEIYLSLLMLSADLHGKGIGRDIYSFFESKMLQAESTSIRLDVVNDYQENVVPFWKSLGFLEYESITLDWGNKKSNAVVMRKNI